MASKDSLIGDFGSRKYTLERVIYYISLTEEFVSLHKHDRFHFVDEDGPISTSIGLSACGIILKVE